MPLTILLATAAIGAGPDVAGAASDASVLLVDRAALAYRFDPGALVPAAPGAAPTQDDGAGAPDGGGTFDLADPAPMDDERWQVPGPPPFGQTGTTRWYIHLDRGWEIDDSRDNLFFAGLGLSHFIDEGLSLDAEINAGIFNQRDQDSSGFNFNLLFRYHFILEPKWSAYVDAGAGILWTTHEVPPRGSKFNFTPQAGLGMTFSLGYNMRLMAGARWHHISNADLFDSNPGRDSIMIYAALNLPF